MGKTAAFRVAALCAAIFIAAMAWDLAIKQPRLGGSQICAKDSKSAQLIGAEKPGVYMFDRKTNLPVRIPASKAFAMVFKGIFNPSYSGQTRCGLRALTQTADGLIAMGSFIGTFVALLTGVIVRRRTETPPPAHSAS